MLALFLAADRETAGLNKGAVLRNIELCVFRVLNNFTEDSVVFEK